MACAAAWILQHKKYKRKYCEEGGIHGEPVGPDKETSFLHLACDMNNVS